MGYLERIDPRGIELAERTSSSERTPEPTANTARGGVEIARADDDARAPNAPSQASAEAPAAPDGSRRFMFDCGNGVTFAVRVVPGEATLFSPQALGAEVIRLPQVAAVSGAHYAAGGVSYWNKGGLATFEIRERTFADCTSNPGAAHIASHDVSPDRRPKVDGYVRYAGFRVRGSAFGVRRSALSVRH